MVKKNNTNSSDATLLSNEQFARIQMSKTDWRYSALVLLICIGIYIPVMGTYGMYDPWETHYTEVARQFMVRGDWLSTYWHNGEGPDGWSETRFWSKPVGSFWMSGLSLKLFGYGKVTGEKIANGNIEWAVRLPFFLCALFGIFCVYLMCARLFNKRVGIFAAIILATAPMYFMIGRQAMTDMPYVGPMSGGIALFILAILGHKEELPRKSIKIGKHEISWPHAICYYSFIATFVLFMILQLSAIAGGLAKRPLFGSQIFSLGLPIVLIYGILAAVLIWMSRKTKTRNEIYLYTFYMVVGIAGLAKGLIGAMQPGLIILVYLITSREWRLLTDAALLRGIFIAVCISFPWYHGMLAAHGRSFWNEFFGTEQLRRLTQGEQKQAKGTFEYYVQQMGYGLYPWIAFIPGALVRFFTKLRERTAQDRACLFIGVWFATTIGLFAITMTKYHHYILPAIPPAAILIALFLDDLLEKKVHGAAISLIVGLGILFTVSIDLITQPAQWVWMYTYLYDSNWAKGVPQGPQILIYAIVIGVIMFFLLWSQIRKYAMWAFLTTTIVIGGYVLNWHQLGCARHWSQKYVIQTYYKMRKSPEEKLIAWQFNWRGETWYTGAEVVVSKDTDDKKIQEWLKERIGTKFFFITERYRYPRLKSMLPTEKGKSTLAIVDDSSVHYVLAAATL